MRKCVMGILLLLNLYSVSGQQQELKCEIFQTLKDSFSSAYKRGDDTLIQIAKEVDSLLKKSGEVEESCMVTAGIILRKAASYCSNRDLYDDGMVFVTRAIEVLNKTTEKKELANSYTTLGIFMSKRNFNNEAITYLEKGLEIRKELGIEKEIANSYNNIGSVYLSYSSDSTDKALSYFLMAKPLAEKSNDDFTLGMTYNNLAVCYQRKKLFEKAVENYFRTLELTKKINHQYGIANTLSNIGQVYQGMKKFRESIPYLKAGMKAADEAGVIDVKKNCCYTLVLDYAGIGNADSAEFYMESYHFLIDSMNQLEHKQDLIDVEARFSLNEKKEQITLLEKQKSLQRSIIWIFSGAMIIILIFAFFLVRSFRQIKQKNKIIEEQKAMVEQKQEEILDSIKYAARIQNALITGEKYIERQLKRMSGKNRN